jgi:enoyl-CoA hydratase
MADLVTYGLNDSVATIVMDDGKVNAISRRMLAELNAALDRAVADEAIVVLTGRPGVFSAGFDLKELSAGGATTREVLNGGFRLAERLLSFPTPVVIACTGHAMAMGVFLVLSGDYRVGADGPYKIVANEVAIGLTMPHTAIEICRARLAPAHFHRAVINAEIYTPVRAVPAGFLDEVVPAADLEHAARDTAARLGALNLPAHKATKLRARSDALKALRRAIELDDAAFT